MAEIIGVKVQLDGGEAIKTVGSLRQQLKAGLTDLQQMQEEFGDISPQAIAAAKSVAELRDRIKDSNEVASLFDPEKKFQAVVGVAQGIASGFAAAQGAMALFGAESKEVEKALLKVQATMALAQGLSGVRAAIEDFKRLGAVLANMSVIQKANAAANTLAAATMRLFGVATTQTAVAFNVLKAAIVSTGIGAAIVLIGTLINKLSDLTSSTNDAAQAQRDFNKSMEEFSDKANNEIIEILEREKQLQIARAKARGATEAEIVEITRKANEEILAQQKDNLLKQQVNGLTAANAKKAVAEQETANELFELGVREKAVNDARAKEKAAQDQSKSEREKAAAQEKQNAEQKVADQKALGETFKAALDADTAAFIQANEDQKKNADDLFLYGQQIRAAEIAEEQRAADEKKAIREAELEHQQEMAFAVANVFSGLAALAGEQTAAGKALAITGAVISTYASAQQAYWAAFNPVPTYLSPVLGALYAAGAVAAGLANVRKIASIPVNGKGGGSVPNISAGGGAAPLTPQRPQTPTTRIDQNSINEIGSAMPTRAYVVESDITESQARMQRIKNAAKFE